MKYLDLLGLLIGFGAPVGIMHFFIYTDGINVSLEVGMILLITPMIIGIGLICYSIEQKRKIRELQNNSEVKKN